MFQSLFSWNLPSDLLAAETLVPVSAVSILVFVELALGLVRMMVSTSLTLCFNPCFRGTCPRTRARTAPEYGQSAVSILVFVELALGQRNRPPVLLN